MSRVPRGVPTITYCRIQSTTKNTMMQGDIVSDGNAVVILEAGQPSSRYEVAQVIDKATEDDEVCDVIIGNRTTGGIGAPLNPVKAFVNDAANVVLLNIGSKQTKKWLYLKRFLLPYLANEILLCIDDRSQLVQGSYFKAQLTLSSFEIQDEIICDLLRPANRGLSITTNLEEGIIVQGLNRETILDEISLRKLLTEACDNRGMHTLPVGGNIDTSTGVFEFRLYQSEGVSSNGGALQTRDCYSRLVVVDVPSTDPLDANNSEEIRILSGPSLNKSLLTFSDVIKKLNNPYRAQLAPFRESRLTHYLSELMGGNSIVVATGFVAPGEPTITRKTMELLSGLNTSVHYPLGARELSDTIRGLLGKYRAMLLHLQDEVNAKSTNIQDKQTLHETAKAQIEELQKVLANEVQEKNKTNDEKNHLFEMAELLKSKYNSLMEEKLKQSEHYANLEEDNLELAKTILELKLQISQLQESHEEEKLSLQQEILLLKNEIENCQSNIQQQLAEKENLTKEIEKKTETIKAYQNDIKLLKNEIEEKINCIDEYKEKNLQLSAELLTLINQKSVFEQENEDLKRKFNLISDEKNLIDLKENELETLYKQSLTKLVERDDEIIKLHQTIDELEKNEKERLLKEKEKLSLNQEVSSTDTNPVIQQAIDTMKFKLENKKEKELMRLNKELTKKCQRFQSELEYEKNINQSLSLELQQLRDKYKCQLELSIENPETSLLAWKDNEAQKNIESKPSSLEDSETSVDLMNPYMKSLLQQYEDRENSLSNQVIQSENSRQLLLKNYRELYDHYQQTVDVIEDLHSLLSAHQSQGSKKNPLFTQSDVKLKSVLESVLSERYQLANQEFIKAENIVSDESLNRKVSIESLKGTQFDISEKEKVAAIISTYQRNLQVAETKLVKVQQENAYLQIQFKQTLANAQTSNLQSESQVDNEKEKKVLFDEEMIKSQNALYKGLTEEIQELKKFLLQREANEHLKQSPLILSRKPSKQLIEVLKEVIASTPPPPVESISPETESISKSLIPPTLSSEVIPKQIPQSPKIPIIDSPPQLMKPPHSSNKDYEQLRSQLLKSEQRAAEMASKQISLEEELQSYQNYMRNVLPQYQKQIQILKSQKEKLLVQIQGFTNNAAITAKKGDDFKLPSIS